MRAHNNHGRLPFFMLKCLVVLEHEMDDRGCIVGQVDKQLHTGSKQRHFLVPIDVCVTHENDKEKKDRSDGVSSQESNQRMFEKLLFLFELPFEDALRQRAKCKSLKKEKEADNDQLSVKNSERKVVIDR